MQVLRASTVSSQLRSSAALRSALIARHVIGSNTLARRTCNGKPEELDAAVASILPLAASSCAVRAPLLAAASCTAAAFSRIRRRSRTGSRQYTIVAACAGTPDGAEPLRAATDGDIVRVNYEGRLEDGTVFDSSKGRDPLSFKLGAGQVVPGFEAAVRGLAIGDSKTVVLPPADAYGEQNEQLILTIPSQNAPAGLQLGDKVTLNVGGNRRAAATVVKLTEDGSVIVDANPPLAGKTLTFDIELVGFKELLAPSEPPAGMALATFAAGCFWGVELAFQRVPGVLSSCVGYAQGEKEAPSYEEVCAATTGHTEAVRVVYDPSKVSFEALLDTFWERVGRNATTLNQAGNDVGPQYRSGIYVHSDEQQKLAEASVEALQERLGEKVVTEVEPAAPFWLAEDYHQQYLEKGGRGGNPQSAEKGCTDTIQCYG